MLKAIVNSPVRSGNQTINNGNLIIGTAGNGIDFAANGGDVLTQYDEGTWTVVWTNLTGTPSNTTGYYTRIGRLVFFTYAAGANTIQGTANSTAFTLPFDPAVAAAGTMISDFANNAGQILIWTSQNAYPEAFNSGGMNFSGVYHI